MKRRKIADQNYDYGTHEALHMSYFLAEAWSERIIDHPRIKENKLWQQQAQKALDEMFKLYQLIGASS
jgi:hypothetical protein